MIIIHLDDTGFGWGEVEIEVKDELELFEYIKSMIVVKTEPELIVTDSNIVESLGKYGINKYLRKIEVDGIRNKNLEDIMYVFIKVESEKLKEKTLLEFKAKKLKLLRRLQEEFGFSVSDQGQSFNVKFA